MFQINSRVVFRLQTREGSQQRPETTGSDQLGQTNPLVETNETKDAEPHKNQLVIDKLNMDSSRKSRQSIQPGTAEISNIPGQQSSSSPYVPLTKRTQSPKSMLRNLNGPQEIAVSARVKVLNNSSYQQEQQPQQITVASPTSSIQNMLNQFGQLQIDPKQQHEVSHFASKVLSPIGYFESNKTPQEAKATGTGSHQAISP